MNKATKGKRKAKEADRCDFAISEDELAEEMVRYKKEVEQLAKRSEPMPARTPQGATESKPTLLISEAVVSALTDKRFSRLPDTFATQLAMQAMRDATRLEISLPRMGPGKSWQDNIAIAALKGDDQFFRDLAASFLALKEQGFSVDGKGIWTKKLTASKGKKYILSHLKSWEADGVKMESRAKEVEAKCGLSRKGFF